MGIKRKGEVRFYRSWQLSHKGNSICYEVRFRQTDLWIRTRQDYSELATKKVIEAHRALHFYASANPAFFSSLRPLPQDPLAPPLVKKMLKAAQFANVGPMAAVAGAIAETVGSAIRQHDSYGEVLVENGGDCYIYSPDPVTVGILPEKTMKWCRKLPKIRIMPEDMPVCICTSSSTVGHSISFGKASAVTVLSFDGALADAVATAICNNLRYSEEVEKTLQDWVSKSPITAVMAVIDNVFGFAGKLELVG